MTVLPLPIDEATSLAVLALLAVVQGLTEFLPVSSSGHLVLAQSVLDFREPALVVDVALHVGTLLAVFAVYRRDLAAILRDVRRGDLREPLVLVAASVPAAVVGIGGRKLLGEVFDAPRLAAAGLLATALVLVVGEWARRRRSPEAAGGPDPADGRSPGLGVALLVGLAQALAVWPGISRSGSTIAMGLLCGLSPRRAARFSFLLSIIAIGGAAVLEIPDAFASGAAGSGVALAVAVLLAGLVGWAALRLLLAFLSRGAFSWFAGYCALLGGGYLLLA